MTNVQIHFQQFQIGKEYQELTQHGTASFPIAFYETQPLLNKAGLISLHWHEEFQICLVTRGCVQFQCDQYTYDLHENEGILINSNRLHMAKTIGYTDGTYICCAFHPKILGSFDGNIIESLYVQPFINAPKLSAICFDSNTDWGKQILATLLGMFRTYCDQEMGYQMLLVSKLLFIWNQIIVTHKDLLTHSKMTESIELQRVKSLMTYIQEEYSNEISLDDIADVARLSKGECCRQFKKITGTTPFEYLQMYRIKQGVLLLETTDMSIGEIASMTGFNSFSYFSVCFKKIIGTTPKQYRKRLQE